MIDPATFPPVELVECEPIRLALVGYVQARQAAIAAGQDLTELEQTRPQSEDADARSLAAAIAEGKRDPGPRRVEQHDKKTADAKRRSAAHALLEERARDALAAALQAHRDEWKVGLDEDRGQALAAKDRAVDALGLALSKLAELEALAQYLRDGRWRGPIKNGFGIPVARTDSGSIPTAAVLTAVRAIGHEPERTATNASQGLQRYVVTRGKAFTHLGEDHAAGRMFDSAPTEALSAAVADGVLEQIEHTPLGRQPTEWGAQRSGIRAA